MRELNESELDCCVGGAEYLPLFASVSQAITNFFRFLIGKPPLQRKR